MFDENFSFLSGTSDLITVDINACTSDDVSPFTSRCASPRLRDVSPGQQPRAQRDSRFDAYRLPRHQSITALTAQLESHVLSERRRPSYTAEYVEPPSPSNSTDQDEGFYDGPDTPSTTTSDYATDFDPTLYDLSMSDLSATSSPRPSLSLEAQATSLYTSRRRQRQALVRLQCLAKRTPDLAMLIEECHPSSLPLSNEALWAASGRSNSTCSITSGRIEKERRPSASVRRAPRMRKRVLTR